MNICVYGIGGIGGSVGGVLCRNLREEGPHKVHFIARGDHLEAIRRNGLLLKLPDNKIEVCHPGGAFSSIFEAPVPDVVFLCVKSYDLPLVSEELCRISNPDLKVIPLLNGFDIYDQIRKIYRSGYVFPSCIYIGGLRTGNGECHFYFPGPIIYGADPMYKDYTPTDLVSTLDSALDKSLLNATWVKDSYPAIWQKYMFNVAVNLMNAYTGKVLGELMVDPSWKQMTREILHETVEIVKKSGAPVSPDAEDVTWGIIEKAPYSTMSAYAVDVEKGSKRNEGEIFGKAIIELGRKTGMKTGKIEFVYGEIEKRLKTK